MNPNLDSLENAIQQLEKNFEQLREDITINLKEFDDCIKSVKQLYRQAVETNDVLENKLANASDEEKQWKDIKAKLATISVQGKIILNVGGEKYTTSVETLTREKNTFFTALLSKQCHIEKDPNDESIFIDRNGKIFTYILEYLRANTVSGNVMKDEILHKSLLIEAEYFQLSGLINILTGSLFPSGTLLKLEHKKQLNEFYGERHQRWELIYKATRDGFNANTFHAHCNNKGPTLTIIQSNTKFLFGAYTSVPWSSDNGYKSDITAFLFTLTNPTDIPPTKYPIHNAKTAHAVYHHSGYGPTFGSGHDIYLANDGNTNSSSYTLFPKSYTDTTGISDKTFTGARNFIVYDVEVFKLA